MLNTVLNFVLMVLGIGVIFWMGAKLFKSCSATADLLLGKYLPKNRNFITLTISWDDIQDFVEEYNYEVKSYEKLFYLIRRAVWKKGYLLGGEISFMEQLLTGVFDIAERDGIVVNTLSSNLKHEIESGITIEEEEERDKELLARRETPSETFIKHGLKRNGARIQ